MQQHIVSVFKKVGLVLALFFMATAVWADGSVKTSSDLYYPSLNTIGGNPKGKITVVEFFDYNCGYCHKLPGILEDVVKSNPNVRIVYRDYPILGSDSVIAARAAIAAGQQNKYTALHNAFFETRQPFTEASIRQIASSLGMNMHKLSQDVNSHSVIQQLRSNVLAASRLGLDGVPVVVVAATPAKKQKSVNAYLLTSPSFSELQDAINKVG